MTNELKKITLKLSAIRSDGLTEAEVADKLLNVELKYRDTRHALQRLEKLIEEVMSLATTFIKKTLPRRFGHVERMSESTKSDVSGNAGRGRPRRDIH